jgi:hypothetical protein
MWIVVFITVAYSCTYKTNKEKLIEYVSKDNDLVQQHIVNGINVKIQYLPPQLKLMRLSTENATARDSADCFLYHDFKVTIYKSLWKPEKKTMEHLNFKIGNDFLMVTPGGDSIATSICERMANGSSETNELLMSFENNNLFQQEKSGFTIVYKDQLLGVGTLIFHIPAKAVQKIPVLN